MFFDGQLQSGIGLALQENKSVVCFARDENEESEIWETEYLKVEEIVHQLQTKAIALKLQAGSQEAGFLAAYFPLTIFPSLIIIKNGQLRGNLQSGVSFDGFRHVLLEALKDQEDNSPNSTGDTVATASSPATASTSRAPEHASLATSDSDITLPHAIGHVYPLQPNTSSSSTSPEQSYPPQHLSAGVQATLAERRKRLEADQKQLEAQALADKKVKGRTQQKEEASKAAQDPARVSQLSHAQQQRKRKQEARQERERILKIIENDKLERRHRSELQCGYNQGESSRNGASASSAAKIIQAKARTRPPTSIKQCALRIRLFDGSSLRSTFSATQNLHADVRAWIDTERTDGAALYTFKQVITPNNNHAIDFLEEMESLETLGLFPNATLLMVPARNPGTAYVPGVNGGLVTKAAMSASQVGASVYAFLASIWLVITNTLRAFFGIRTQHAPQNRRETAGKGKELENQYQNRAKVTGVAIIGNVRMLKNQDTIQEDRQFYNGNQLNFEPRDDEPDEDHKP